jgi:NADP-dependent 3-hydroxy acid dehydrogenase YdfG
MEFAKAGYSVVLNARNEVELKQSANDISKSIKDSRVISKPGDISQEQVCMSLIKGAVKQFGRIDVMVNNAGREAVKKMMNSKRTPKPEAAQYAASMGWWWMDSI